MIDTTTIRFTPARSPASCNCDLHRVSFVAHHRVDTRRRLGSVARVVPEPDHAPLALVAEVAQRGGAERERGRGLRRESEPAGADDPEDVAVAEQHDVAAGALRAGDDAVGAGGRLGQRLAAGSAVRPQVPAWTLLADAGRREALVVAVAELVQVVGDLDVAGEARQPRRLQRPRHRAAQHEREAAAGEPPRERLGTSPAFVEEWEVRAARVLARAAPLRLAVADEQHSGSGPCHACTIPDGVQACARGDRIDGSMNGIVVGTDGSPGAEAAVQKVIEFTRGSGATVHLVCAFPAPSALERLGMTARQEPTDLRGVAYDVLARGERRFAEAGFTVEKHAREGDPAQAIIDVATENDAELIAVGARGNTALRRFMLGSVSSKLSHHATRSLLIVRED